MWGELGIEPTRDPARIRRAYAVRLKQARPETDPAGFTKLRAAFEAALRWAAAPPAAQAAAQATGPQGVRPTPPPEPAASGPEHEIGRLLAEGRLAAAAEALAQAADRLALPLGSEIMLKDRLLSALVLDRSIPAPALRDYAARLGWTGPLATAAGDSALLRDLQAKLEAANWHERLHEVARSRRYRLGDEAAAAARLLLGRSEPLARLVPPVPDLRRQLGLYRMHRRWIGHLFEAATVERAQALADRSYPGRYGKWLWRCLRGAALVGMVAASSMVFLPIMLALPYCRISGYSRPALAAFAAIALTCGMMAALLPCGLIVLASDGSARPGIDMPIELGWCVAVATVFGLKQLFLPGRRVR